MHCAQSIPECDLKLEILANSFYPGMVIASSKDGTKFWHKQSFSRKKYLDKISWILASCLIFYTIELTLHLPQWANHTAKKWHLDSSTYTKPFFESERTMDFVPDTASPDCRYYILAGGHYDICLKTKGCTYTLESRLLVYYLPSTCLMRADIELTM